MSNSEMLEKSVIVQISQDKLTAYIQFNVADEKFELYC